MKGCLLAGLFAVALFVPAGAQAPPGINYQGVARDSEGKPVVSKSLSVRISILKNSASGDVEFSETHQVMTNQFGLFALVIGKGSAVTGSFPFVSWAMGNKWLQIEMDVNGGNNFQIMGTQELMSVPYSFYSQYSGNGLQAGQGISIANSVINNTGDADSNPTNELISGVSLGTDNKLKITDAGGTHEADLSSLIVSQDLAHVLSAGNDAGAQKITHLAAPTGNGDAATKGYVDTHTDADADPLNEIQDLSLASHVLKITNHSTATPIDLSPYLDNTDAQSLSLSGTTLAIAGGNSVNLAGVNTDAQNLSLGTSSGTSRTINISGGTGVTVDVADNDDNPINEAQTLSKTSNLISLSNVNGAGGGSVTLNDDDPLNEIQDLALTSNVLKMTKNAAATGINLALYLDNTDSQALSLGAVVGTQHTINLTGSAPITLDVADNDNNPTNEIQDLSLTANTLKITNNAAATPVNLAPYLDNTDNQTLTYNPATNNLAISTGNNVTISHTLGQVLTQGNDAGAKKITNLSAPTLPADATTKQYVDNADAALASLISTTYAFKTAFSFTNGGSLVENDRTIPFTTEEFDDFGVLAVNSFTAATNGIYVFTVDGTYAAPIAGGQLSLLFNGVKYPIAIVQPWGGVFGRFNATFMFKLIAGQTVNLVGDNILVGGQFTGGFYGYKL
jgi:hypothetical protein